MDTLRNHFENIIENDKMTKYDNIVNYMETNEFLYITYFIRENENHCYFLHNKKSYPKKLPKGEQYGKLSVSCGDIYCEREFFEPDHLCNNSCIGNEFIVLCLEKGKLYVKITRGRHYGTELSFTCDLLKFNNYSEHCGDLSCCNNFYFKTYINYKISYYHLFQNVHTKTKKCKLPLK